VALAVAAVAWSGDARRDAVIGWSVVAVGGMLAAFALIRSGQTRRFADPALSAPLMFFTLSLAGVGYALAGPARGALLPVVTVVLMFGMFGATARQLKWTAAYAVALFGAVMALMAWRDPVLYTPAVEAVHFLVVATMTPAAAALAGRLGRMQLRTRAQRAELASALARIRELATRDELTGLWNRRQMLDAMEQEHQRCIRSGRTFCLAVLDIDRFEEVGDRFGPAAGDEALRRVANEASRHVRLSDVLARWRGERFVLMMSDARIGHAHGAVERLRACIGAQRIDLGAAAPLRLTLSAGLAEHRAGETVAQTLERADRALLEARRAGGDRTVDG
jgi:diguanylate cyclase (GGDEF)-like protein